MAGLYVVQDATFSSLATGAIIVVAVAVLGSLTVLPALLAKLGRWVDRPRVPLLWRVNRRIGRGGISRRVLGPVLRHPKASLLRLRTHRAALAVPALGMNMKEAAGDAAARHPRGQHRADDPGEFPSEGRRSRSRSSHGRRSEVVAALQQLVGRGSKAGLVADDDAIRTSRDGSVSVLTLASPYADGSEQTRHALDTVRDDLAPDALDPLPGTEWAVGGDTAESADFTDHQRDKLPWVIGFVLPADAGDDGRSRSAACRSR